MVVLVPLLLALPVGPSACSIRQALRPEVYQVARGDTLYSIAWHYQIPWQDLARWNRIPAPYTIYPGKILSLDPYMPPRYLPPVTGAPPQVAVARPPDPPDRQKRPDRPDQPDRPDPPERPPPPTHRPVTPAPARQPAAAPVIAQQRWQWPAQGPLIRRYDASDPRHGIDIGGSRGDPVRAARGGHVVYSGSGLKGYGNLIIIKHEGQYLSAYGFNRRLLVEQGAEVEAGEKIAEMGIGPQREPLLHFEVRRNGDPLDPLRVLPDRRP